MNIFTIDPAVKKLLGWKISDEEEKWALKAIESLVKKMRKRKYVGIGTIEDLEYALAHPGSRSRCVTIPRSLDGRLQVSHRKALPHVIYCRVWRWPSLQSHNELKPTVDCQFPYTGRNEQICINPYHYQRVEVPSKPSFLHPPQQSNSSLPLSPSLFGSLGDCQMPSASSAATLNRHFLLQQSPSVSNGGGGGLFGLNGFNIGDSSPRTTLLNNSNNSEVVVRRGLNGSCETPTSSCLFNNNNGISPIATPSPSSLMMMHTPSTSLSMGTPQPQPQQQQQQLMMRPELLLGGGQYAQSVSTPSSLAQSPSALSDDDDCRHPPPFHFNFNGTSPAAAGVPTNPASNQAWTTTMIATPPPPYWCSICYYELNSRVGEPFKVHKKNIVVDGFTAPFSEDPLEERICLGLLSNVNRNATIDNTRKHIGNGVKICCTDSQVTLFNSSNAAVFIQSRNANFKHNLQSTAVCRVPPQALMLLFDLHLFNGMLDRAKVEGFNHVYELQKMCFIRISFVKGWGADYHRKDITSTPCWLELQLHLPLTWIDSVLSQLEPPQSMDVTSVS